MYGTSMGFTPSTTIWSGNNDPATRCSALAEQRIHRDRMGVPDWLLSAHAVTLIARMTLALKGAIDAEAQRAGILSLALSSGGVALEDAAALDVHPMTIRRDFEALERDGKARRVRGGVMMVGDYQVEVRRTQDLPAKRAIAL